jgi:aminoglycoside N3'-acetyltransferase
MIKYYIKKITPESLKNRIKTYKLEQLKKQVQSNKPINKDDFVYILKDILKIKIGDTLLIHSSIDRLNITFPFYNIIDILFDIIGNNGTILFPTYPQVTSYEFLKSDKIFDIKRTPSYTGILSEFARRNTNAVRSLHPIKSVAAIGKNAEYLTNSHQNSPFPYDSCSPYFKIFDLNAKIIGLGIKSTYLSCVHCVDDFLKENFPINPYHTELFSAKCKNYNREIVIVKTYAHDMRKMGFCLSDYFKKYIPEDICYDIELNGAKFFSANSKDLFNSMLKLAKNNITIYS